MGNADLMPRHALPHPVELTGLRTQPSRQLAAPLLVERRDQEFVAGLLADLALPQRHDELRSQAPRSQGSMLRLFQPVQRVFNMAVLEAWCDVPGTPRLDPAKIDSAGLVIRKLVDGQPRAWIKAGTRILGWEQVDGEVDPAADKRAPALSLGDAATDRVLPSNRLRRAAGMAALLQHDADITEDVIPLFVAPPEVCSAAGRTLLFGNLPVTSGEQAEADQKRPGYGASRAERDLLQAHLYGFFRSGSSWKPAQPGVTIDRSHVESAQKKPAQSDDERRDYELLLELLRQACIEFDVLGESAEAKALFAQLQRISVERDIHINGRIEVRQQPAGDFLRKAARVMLDDEPGASFVMPHRRAALAENIAGDFFEASLRALDAQSRKLGIGRGRYEPERNDEQPRYVARAFLRLKPEHPGCPPRLLWSPYSSAYTIAPWYESAGMPPPLVPMPNLFDREVLKTLKPNVAFALPPKLAQLLTNDPKKLRDGEGSGEGGLDLGWICSFSIPIITLCAFIVLNIFLTLFDLIFKWMLFLKICIPYPKKG